LITLLKRSWNLEGMCPVAFKVVTCID